MPSGRIRLAAPSRRPRTRGSYGRPPASAGDVRQVAADVDAFRRCSLAIACLCLPRFEQEDRMQSKSRSLVTCTAVSLFVMAIVTYAAGSDRARGLEHQITAEVVELESPMVVHDDVAGAACGRCGDNFCNPRCGETATSCPKDCGGVTLGTQPTVEPIELMCGKCGDNFCNPRCGETAASCPRDCGGQTSHMDAIGSSHPVGEECGDVS